MKPSYVITFLLALSISCNAFYSQKNLISIDKKSLIEFMAANTYQLLDVRTEKEFKQGAIEGAIHIDYWDPNFEQKVISALNKRITTVVYCAAGGRSEMACKLLLKKGFKLLYDLKGGYEEFAN